MIRLLVAAAEHDAHNPIVPESSAVLLGAVAFVVVLVPVLLLCLVVWSLSSTGRNAERVPGEVVVHRQELSSHQ